MAAAVPLFCYGTLQQREVQLANFGRELEGQADALAGHRLGRIEIDDPDVISVSGKAIHTIARATADPGDRIPGTVFLLSQQELEASDAYETDAYTRVEVVLESGRRAFVYVGAPLEKA